MLAAVRVVLLLPTLVQVAAVLVVIFPARLRLPAELLIQSLWVLAEPVRPVQLTVIMVATLQPLAKLPQVAVAVAALVRLALVALAVGALAHLLQVILRARLELRGKDLLAAVGKAAPLTLKHSVVVVAEALQPWALLAQALAQVAERVQLLLLRELQLHALAAAEAVGDLILLGQVVPVAVVLVAAVTHPLGWALAV